MTPEQRLEQMGLVLPPVPVPVANYVPFRLYGPMLYLSGQGPKRPDGTYRKGRLGRDISIEEAYAEARLAGLQLLAAAKAVIKLLGMVNAEPDFADHPKVINGCSDLFVEVLGDAGRHARSAVGMGSLPNAMAVEVEAILAIRV